MINTKHIVAIFILIVFAAVIFTAFTSSNTKTQEDAIDIRTEIIEGPSISFDRATHDFDQIPKLGGTVSAGFNVINMGDEVLEFGKITTSCGCTSIEPFVSQLAPGESAKLTVIFDPNFHNEPAGVLERTVFIPTNDPNTPEAEVTISVEIID